MKKTTAKKSSDVKNWAVLCHLSTFSGFIIPLGNILGPFVVWLFKKDELKEVDFHAKEAINFQISMTIYLIASIPFMLILVGIPVFFGILLADLVLTIKAMIETSNGVKYKYPVTIRFFK